MTDSLHNLIAAQGDAVIPNLRYADLAAPTASYVIDKRSTRVPFLAPIYSSNNVSVARAIIADPGFLVPVVNEPQPFPEATPLKKTPYIAAGASKRVWHKPIFGLLNSNNHWIPTQYCPLTFEFTLQDGAHWCDTSDRVGGGGAVINA